MSQASKRELVLKTAQNLFLERGFQATGINLITREAGVASSTLYNNFKDKDELIVAVLEQNSQAIQEELKEKLAGKKRVIDRLEAIFDALLDSDGEAGLIFIAASLEFREDGHPARDVVRAHRDALLELLEDAVKEEAQILKGLPGVLMTLLNGAEVAAAAGKTEAKLDVMTILPILLKSLLEHKQDCTETVQSGFWGAGHK